jgi:hypothetical protein
MPGAHKKMKRAIISSFHFSFEQFNHLAIPVEAGFVLRKMLSLLREASHVISTPTP